MFKIPCKEGNMVLSIVSFIFLSASASGLSLTIHNSQNMPFLKKNSQVLIPFLSLVCAVSSLLFLYTFLDIYCRYKYCCIRCCYNTKDNTLYDDNYQDENLYNDVDTTINVDNNRNSNSNSNSISNSNSNDNTKKETDPLLYPKMYPELISSNINIPRRTYI